MVDNITNAYMYVTYIYILGVGNIYLCVLYTVIK